jgi:PAS domain S-box-containing protein
MHSPARSFSARFFGRIFSTASWLDLASREATPPEAAGRKPPHATYITDADWKITHVSAGFTLLSGLNPNDVMGKTPAELIAPEDGDCPVQTKSVHTRLCLGSLMKRKGLLLRRDGTRLRVRVCDTPLFDEEGRLSNVIGEIERAGDA